MAKISVIIPVYGVEKYLNRCVESVVNQTYKDLEIILIDDGSPDNCPKMCDKWASRDARIRTVHRENGGQSCARNTGLSIASGEYVTFVDSDDWISLDTYEYCVKLLRKYEGADAIEFDATCASDKDIPCIRKKETVNEYEGKDILDYYMESSTKHGTYSVCSCIFKAQIAKKFIFREGKINEDIDYKYKVLRECKKIVVTNQVKYYYWQEGNSTSSGPLKAKDFQLYEAAEELYNLAKDESYGKIAYYAKVKKARTPFSMLCRIAIWGINDTSIDYEKTVNRLVAEHRQNLRLLLTSPIGIKRKVAALLFAVNFRFFQFCIRKIK